LGRPYARAWTVLLVQLSVKYDGSKLVKTLAYRV
jgi:hypothetical protein